MQVGNLLHEWKCIENDHACNKLPTSFQLVRLVGCCLNKIIKQWLPYINNPVGEMMFSSMYNGIYSAYNNALVKLSRQITRELETVSSQVMQDCAAQCLNDLSITSSWSLWSSGNWWQNVLAQWRQTSQRDLSRSKLNQMLVKAAR